MKKLRGLKLINTRINRWLKKYKFKCRVCGVDTDFYWYSQSNTISYSFFFQELAEKNWEQLLQELDCKYQIDTFFSSLMHEIGHSQTYYDFTDEELTEYYDAIENIKDEPNAHYEYTHLPVEYEATRWAVEYINKYPERVEELVKKVGKAVRRFYKINKVVSAEMFI